MSRTARILWSLSDIGTVLAQLDDGLTALDVASGRDLWSRPDVVYHAPIADTGMLWRIPPGGDAPPRRAL
jgi:hypothetical protein